MIRSSARSSTRQNPGASEQEAESPVLRGGSWEMMRVWVSEVGCGGRHGRRRCLKPLEVELPELKGGGQSKRCF